MRLNPTEYVRLTEKYLVIFHFNIRLNIVEKINIA